MIPEFGHFVLILALGVSLLQALVPVVGYVRRDVRLMSFSASAAQAAFFLVLASYFALSWSFVHNDFSVGYVAANSHSQLPLMYRLSAVWGAHEGSLLLWMLMLSGWGCAVSVFNARLSREISALVLATLGAIGVAFLLFMLITSNPFGRVFPVPTEGRDLNPLLQYPGLVVHPPMLYMGYVGFSVAFAFAIAALITGKLDGAWARWTRPWTTTAWLFLTMGITLGSWWAYNELGWGGWWFWDPVENASFMPWLVGTALIHSLAVTEKRGLLKSWTVLLAILAFALSLLGTFLVRSGVIVSVHAFASDPERGVFILGFLCVVVGSALALYAWRAPRLASTGEFSISSREGLLLLNNVFLVAAAGAVLLGTLYPLFVDALGIGKISVGPPYFNMVFLPLFLPLLLLVGFSGEIGWKRAHWRQALQRLKWPALVAALMAALLPFAMQGTSGIRVAGGTLLATWVLAGGGLEIIHRVRAKRDRLAGLRSIPRGVWGMTMAHLGLGFWLLGVTYVSLFSVEKDVRLGPGQSADIGAYRFELEAVNRSKGANFDTDIGAVKVWRGDALMAELAPEKRFYPSQRMAMTEAAVDHTPLRDLYVSLGEPLEGGDWAVRLYYKPMMRLVWFGGVLMFLGGILAASDRRYRSARVAAGATAGAAVTG